MWRSDVKIFLNIRTFQRQLHFLRSWCAPSHLPAHSLSKDSVRPNVCQAWALSFRNEVFSHMLHCSSSILRSWRRGKIEVEWERESERERLIKSYSWVSISPYGVPCPQTLTRWSHCSAFWKGAGRNDTLIYRPWLSPDGALVGLMFG